MYLMHLREALLPPFKSIVELCVVVPFLIWLCFIGKEKRFMKNTQRRPSACLWALSMSSCESSMALGSNRRRPTRREGTTAQGSPKKLEVVRG